MAAVFGGSPGWWLDQDETMIATGLEVLERLKDK